MKTVGVLFGDYLRFEEHPFSKKRTNKAYQLFSKIAKEKDVIVLISTFKNLSGRYLKKAWVYDNFWQLVENREIDLIFDRERTTLKNEEKKEEIGIKLVNDPGLNKLCWDKMQTYDYFSEMVPRTFLVNNIDQLKEIMPQIKTEKIVLKPRYGIMGKDILFVNKKDVKEARKNTVVQEFIDSSVGIKELGIEGVHDLRIMIINGEIDHFYVRAAKKDSLLANCAQGGKKIFIENEKIPKSVLNIANEIDDKLMKYEPRIYAIDFVFDKNGKLWVMELESIPGFAYYDGAEEIRINFLKKLISVLKDEQ